MISLCQSSLILNNLISVEGAAIITGYSKQYLRRLLRLGKLDGHKIGQIWLINMQSLDSFLYSSHRAIDRRFGPKNFNPPRIS
jgi:excisionase family DNA binding protein